MNLKASDVRAKNTQGYMQQKSHSC